MEIFAQITINSLIIGSVSVIIVVEHNIKSLLHIVSRAYVLDKGTVVTEDTPRNLLESDILERDFLGKPV
jgi:ABC-type lipopolysaccharide export system ATPase subunit